MPPEQRKIVNGLLIEAMRLSASSLRVYVDDVSVDMSFDEAVEWAQKQTPKRKNGKKKKP